MGRNKVSFAGMWAGGIIAAIVAIFAMASGYSISTISRPTNYQGVNLTWQGATIGSLYHDGQSAGVHKYYAEDMALPVFGGWGTTHRASDVNFGRTEFSIDPDEAGQGIPTLRGSVDQPYPSPEFNDSKGAGHYRTFSWDITNTDGTSEHYEMDEWVFETNINLAASPKADAERDGRFLDTDIWLKAAQFMPDYFETDDAVFQRGYITIAKIEIERVWVGLAGFSSDKLASWGIHDVNSPTSSISANLNEGQEFSLFYSSPNGIATSVGEDKILPYYYNEVKLNPDIFRDNWYIPIRLNSFGTEEGGFIRPWYSWKMDALTLKIRLHLFTVGEWTVRQEAHVDWGALVGSYGETSSWDKFVNGIIGFFTSWIGILLTAIIIIIILFGFYTFMKLITGGRGSKMVVQNISHPAQKRTTRRRKE